MTRYLFLLIALLCSIVGASQNTDISGIINAYQQVNEINEGILDVDSSLEFEADDLVLLIQMQGAEMNESNSNQFGNVLDLNSVGNYEFVRICEIISETEIRIIPPLRTYDTNGIVQIVTVPYYENANVTSILTCTPWNGAIGGILVFECENDLTLNADIDVSGRGFRGGEIATSDYFCSWLFNVNDYFYDINSGEGAEKGEGIAFFIPNKTAGRGAQVNGGGGGNDHNSGGGGGSNAGLGGKGGERISPATFACSGANPGIGGKLLAYSESNNKIYLGGGGGAGHENNANTATPGSNGGGIVIIQANSITSNSHSILAHGQNLESASEDGAGGGGAGGTTLLEIEEYTDILNIDLSGANGGDVSNVGSSNCNGPGGGGGGGFAWISLSETTENTVINTSGGEGGVTLDATQDNCTIGSSNDSEGGSEGLVFYDLVLEETPCMPDVFSTVFELCLGDSLFVGGAWQTEEGAYYDEIPNECCAYIQESIIEFATGYITDINETLCFGESLFINGNEYTSSIVDGLEIKENEGDCDSIWNINLTVLPEASGVETITACNFYTWLDGYTYTENNNTASFLIENGSQNGCDSIALLDLTLLLLNTEVAQDGNTLTSLQDGAYYQWLDCDNGFTFIEGATNQSFTPINSGSYSVIVSQEPCNETSSCYTVNIIGLEELAAKNNILVYPNPNDGKFEVDLGRKYTKISAVVRNENGQLVKEFQFVNSRILYFEIEGASGVYILDLTISPTEKVSLKIQKN